jgi:alpha-L-fucosidase 2
MVPGVMSEIRYRGPMTLDAYAPPGARRPAAILIHGAQGDKSTHLTQLFDVLDRAGFAWFSIDYRGLDDVRAAMAYIHCPGRFNISSRLVVIAEDSGVPLALGAAQEVPVSGLVLFGARFGRHPGAARFPVLVFHGTADDEAPAATAEKFCRQWADCRFSPVAGAIHNFENWHPDQWQWKEELVAWLRGDERGLWKDITYARPGGRNLQMDAFIPEGPGPFPAVVIAHGGGWEAGDKVTYVAPVFSPLARAGFAWFSIDYRLTPYVRNPEQLEDLRSAIRYVRGYASRFHVDPRRVALLGESASAQMVTQVVSEPCPGCEVQAVVAFYGVYDFTPWAKDPTSRPMLDRLFGQWDLETLKRYSPLYAAHAGLPPLLLLQGTADELYPGTLAYARRLKRLGASCKLILLDGAPHGMENWAGHPQWQTYRQQMVDWLRAALAIGR